MSNTKNVKASQTHQNSGQRIAYGPFGEIGYILKNPTYVAMASNRITSKMYKNRELMHTVSRNVKALKKEAFMRDYHERLDLAKVRSAARRLVELGMKQAEEELEQKRNRLRKSFLEEDSKHIAEYTLKAQTSLDRKMEVLKKKVEEIERKNKMADSLHTQKAYEKLAIEKDEDFREELRLKIGKNVGECLKAQMCEKEYGKIQEENDERILDKMSEDRIQAEKQEIENAVAMKFQRQREWVGLLNKQIESREMLKQNQKCLDEIEKTHLQEFADEREAQYQMMDRVSKERLQLQAKILAQQVEERKRMSEKNKEEENYIRRIFIEDDRRKVLREEANRVVNRNQLRAELGYFKEASVQYANAVAKNDAEVQTMIEDDRNRMDTKYLLERRKKEIERRNFAGFCSQQTKQMIADKAAKKVEIGERDAKCNMVLDYRNEMNEQLDRGRAFYNPLHEKPRTVVLQNEQNEKYLEVLRQRQKLEDHEMLEKMRNAREQMQSRIREIMSKPLPEIAGTSLHPFYGCVRPENS